MAAVIRALGVDDLDALHALELRAQPLPWSDDQLLLELVNDDAIVLGAEVPREAGPELVGHICARRMLDELWILNLAVAPAARRHGHASALLQSAASWGVVRGLMSLWLEVRETNDGARRLYEGFGLVEVGRRPGYYPPVPPASERETAVLMRRALSPELP